MLPTVKIEEPATDIELQDLANNGIANSPFPVTVKIDKKDIEKQLKPRKRLQQMLQKHSRRLEVLFRFSTAFLFLFIFINVVIHLCQIFRRAPDIGLYIPQTIDIGSLSAHGQALHKADYESLFHDDPNVASYSYVQQNIDDGAIYIPLSSYYKDYSYMQRHRNLSALIDVSPRKISIATIIDRSVTTKTPEEIYKRYGKNSLKDFYNNLQKQQPVHILKNMNPPDETSSEDAEEEKIKHIRFLANFIILFSPVNNEQNDYLGLNNSTATSEKLFNLLSNALDGSEISGLIAADATFSIILAIFCFPFLASAACLEFRSGFFYLSLLAILSFIFSAVILGGKNDIIELHESLLPITQHLYLGKLVKLAVICVYNGLQMLLAIIAILTLYCSVLFRVLQEG